MKPWNLYLAVGTVSAAATFGVLTLLCAANSKLAPAPAGSSRAPEHLPIR